MLGDLEVGVAGGAQEHGAALIGLQGGKAPTGALAVEAADAALAVLGTGEAGWRFPASQRSLR
jgi:hypothetical protein